jgi:DNA-binding XRE family transcriptional regulator
MDAKKIGIYLKEKRRGIDATQLELSEMLGVTHQAVSRWETGESIPDVIMLEKLSELYKVSIDEIVRQEEAENSVKKVELVNSNYSNILVGSIISLLSFCVSTLVLYFAFLEIEIWIWIILAIALYVFSLIPFIYVSSRSVNRVQKRKYMRIVSDSLVVSVFISVVVAFSKYTEIDIQDHNDFYYLFIPTAAFLFLLVDYVVRFVNAEHNDTILKHFVSSLRAKSIVEISLLTAFLVFIVSTAVLFPVLRGVENTGV